MGINLAELFVKIGAQLKGFDEVMGKVEKKLHGMSEKLQRAGVGLSLALSAPLGALAAGAIRSSIGFETAMASVRKNVDGTEADLQKLAGGIEDLSTRIPATTKQIAAVASAAGQLGIASQNILPFTETMIALGETTDLTADQAAVAMAQIATVTQMPQDQFDRLASTLLKLGKSSNTTESQIAELTVRIAGSGTQIGLAQSELLAFASATASVGIKAEAGGTALTTTFIEIAKAVSFGGQKLEEFARVAGQTSEEFASSFRKDAAGAIASFIEGIGRLSAEGENIFQIFGDVDLESKRTITTLANLSTAGDELRRSLELARREWEENVTLTETVNRAYGTTGSQLTILRNKLDLAAKGLGDALIPAFKDLMGLGAGLIQALTKIARGFGSWDEGSRKVVATLGLLAIAAGPVLLVISGIVRGLEAATIAASFLARHPLVLLAVALTGLVTVVAAYVTGSSKAEAQTTAVGDAAGVAAQRVNELHKAFEKIGDESTKVESALKHQEQLLAQLQRNLATTKSGPEQAFLRDQIKATTIAIAKLREELGALGEAQEKAAGDILAEKGDQIFAGMNARLATINKTFRLNVERMGEAKATQRKLSEESALYESTLQQLLQILPEYDSRVLAVHDGLVEVTRAQAEANDEMVETAQVVAGADKAYATLQARLEALGLTGKFFGDKLGATRAQIRETESAIADLFQRGKEQGLSDEQILNTEGVQAAIAELDQLRAKYQEVAFTHEDFARSFTDTFTELGHQLQVTGAEVATLLFDTFNSLAQGLGQAVAQAIVYGESFEETISQIGKQIASQFIANLIAMGIQEIAFLVLGLGAAAKRTSAQLASAAALIYATTFLTYTTAASELGLAGIPLLAAAPGLAAATSLGAVAGASAAGAAGAAAGGGIVALAEGGIAVGPTLALIGEAGPEAVIPLNDRHFRPDPTPIHLDVTLLAERRAIARMVLEEMPFELQKKLGNAFG